VTKLSPSCAKQSFGEYALEKNVTDCFLTLNDLIMNLKSQAMFFRHNGTFTRPTSYSDTVFSTCDVRFSVVAKPIYVPSHRARITNKTIWVIRWHFRFSQWRQPSSIWGIDWHFNKCGFERHIRIRSSDYLLGWFEGRVSKHFKRSCEDATSQHPFYASHCDLIIRITCCRPRWSSV
jgi:hypothetical protein